MILPSTLSTQFEMHRQKDFPDLKQKSGDSPFYGATKWNGFIANEGKPFENKTNTLHFISSSWHQGIGVVLLQTWSQSCLCAFETRCR